MVREHRVSSMLLYMCGFNPHRQLSRETEENISKFQRVCRSPQFKVWCALWSANVIEDDTTLIHCGYCPPKLDETIIDGPPSRNLKAIFGDLGGVLGALSTDGSLYIFHNRSEGGHSPVFKKHRFDEESFIARQNLAIDHIAIADNGEVAVITSTFNYI